MRRDTVAHLNRDNAWLNSYNFEGGYLVSAGKAGRKCITTGCGKRNTIAYNEDAVYHVDAEPLL